MPDELPLLDARRLPDPALAASIRQHLARGGYLLVDGAFAEENRDLAALAAMRRFFSLADDDACKQSVCVSSSDNTHGWMPLYSEPAYEAGTLARVESFDCGRPAQPEPANRWPDLPGFRAATEGLWESLTVHGLQVLEAVAGAIGLERRFLREHCASQALSTMRLLHYPGEDRPAADHEVGISAHSDFECLTLIYQTAPGLELRAPDGSWQEAPAGDRRLIVLAGDMLEYWTNGTIPATAHRVRLTTEKRYSMVLFFAVDDGVEVAPLPAFVSATRPAAYPPVTQRAHSTRQLTRAEENRDRLQSA